jgi:predicted nucleotidyltransferase
MFSKNGNIQLIDFAYSRILNEVTQENEKNSGNVFEGTIYYSARIDKSRLTLLISVDPNGEYPSHFLPKHDLESVIYVMASM